MMRANVSEGLVLLLIIKSEQKNCLEYVSISLVPSAF
jgi:hypothetical protein